MATWRMRQDLQQEVSMEQNVSRDGSIEKKIFGTDNVQCLDFII
jgi:hypothetical protein